MRMFSYWMLVLLITSAPALAAQNLAAPAAILTTKNESLDAALRETARALPLTTADGATLASNASHILLLDADTGTVLADKAADAPMYPSSMTKMMTLYLVFDKLKQGTIKLDTRFTISEKAWRMQGSKMFVPLGEAVTVEDLIRGIAIQSGNDACIAVAEGIAGSEEAFAKQMNDTAKKLGMANSNFVDASGWPHADHQTTARDLATLAYALIRDFPQYYHYFSEKEFIYHGITQFNRNLLLGDVTLGVDGLKTGHTEAAGYGITLAARDPVSGRRLILVVNGLDSEVARAEEGKALLTWGLRNFKNLTLVKPGQTITQAKLWLGQQPTVPLTVKDSVTLTVPATISAADIKFISTYKTPIKTPVMLGQEVGTLTIKLPTGASKEVPLVAGETVMQKGFVGRIFAVWASWLGL